MPDSLENLATPLHRLLSWLASEKIPHVVIGGVAASQLGSPRATADIDVLALLPGDEAIRALLSSAARYGFRPRRPDAEQFARQNRVLLLEHIDTAVGADISLGLLPFEHEVVARATRLRVGSLEIPLPAVEDLIILKGVAHRPRDLQDIQALVERHPHLDTARIQTVLAEFAQVLDMPEILESVLSLLPRSSASSGLS